MFICHCRAVTDHEITDAIGRGAATIEDLAAQCGAGARCGGCWPALYELLNDRSDAADRPTYVG